MDQGLDLKKSFLLRPFNILFIIFLASCSHASIKRENLKQEISQPIKLQLKPFVSDGCSRWSEGTRNFPRLWLRCCIIHDRVYWLGGTWKERLKADNDLKECVHKQSNFLTAFVMYLGVRFGGDPHYHTSYRWGYGWNYKRGYISLTQKEKEYASKLSPWKPDQIYQYLNVKKL